MSLRLRGYHAWAILGGCLLAAFLLPLPTQAQSPSLPAIEDLSYRPLGEALLAFQNATGLDLSYDPRLVTRKWTRAVVVAEETQEAYLQGLLEGTGLVSYRLPSGTYTIREQPRTPDATGSLVGFVMDDTGTPLPQASVRLRDMPEQGVATNGNGLFYFKDLPPGTYILHVTYVGYDPAIVNAAVQASEQTSLNILLHPTLTSLPNIFVEADLPPFESLRALHHGGPITPLTQTNALGTADAVRSMNNLPGVRVGDAMADVHIQGGDPGEHQFRLDGVPVFEPVHLRGLLGAFNPFAIERLTVYKAGFSAAEGSQLSGVIDAQHALSSTDNTPIDLQADPLSLNARLNLGFGDNDGIRGQFMAAYRSSMWDGVWENLRPAHIDSLLLDWNEADPFLLRASLFSLDDRPDVSNIIQRLEANLDSLPPPAMPELSFDDLHAAGRLRFPGGNALYAAFYQGNNLLEARRLFTAIDSTSQDLSNPDRYTWTNENAQLRWNAFLGSNTLFSTRLWTTRYNLQHAYKALGSVTIRLPGGEREQFTLDLTAVDDSNRVRESSFESTLDWTHPGGHLETGFELTRTSYRFLLDDAFTQSVQLQDTTWRAAVYAEERLNLGPGWTITLGGRLTYLQSDSTVYAEPRVAVQYQVRHTPVGSLSLRTAAGLYRQYLNQFDMSNISPSTLFPSLRFWIPADSTINPPRAYHVAADAALQPTDAWMLRVETYYKDQPNLLRINYPLLWDRRPSAFRPPIQNQNEFLTDGHGYAYGAAGVIMHGSSTTRTSLRYEYNIARREYTFEDTTRIASTPWSEPHQVEVALDWFPHPRFSTTIKWRGAWGRTWAFRTAYYDRLGSDPSQDPIFGEYDFSRPEDHTLPTFQQLDLGMVYTQEVGPTALQLRLDVVNALNRLNISDRSLIDIEQEDGPRLFIAQDRPLLSRTVSLALRVKW